MPSKTKSSLNPAGPAHPAAGQPPADQPPTRPAAPPARSESRRWSVTIPYVPPTVVEADDEAGAWERFKAKWGIVKSEHVPAISEVIDPPEGGTEEG